MKKVLSFLVVIGIFYLPNFGYASKIDTLVNKLVRKGILSREEAYEIVQETEEEIRKQTKTRGSEIPEWMKNLKLKGDFRLRYQWQDNSHKRERVRIRLRVGAIAKPCDGFKVGFGLATGGSDPRSTNVTLDSSFESKDIKLDYAYAEYSGIKGLTIWGGKYKGIKKAIWRPSDLLWDSDLRPEGVGIKFNRYSQRCNIFTGAGLWILNEVSSGADALMFYVQPGIKLDITQNLSFKAAMAYYSTSSVKGHTLKHSAGSNTLTNDGLKYDYDVWAPSMELEFRNLTEFVPYIAFFGDYVNNSDPDDKNQGYLVGLKFGDKKIKKLGSWQFKYMYRRLEKDAWLDVFPDSDAYGGKTGVEGHEMEFKFGLVKNLILGLDYYHMEQISLNEEENLLQVDLVWKF